MAGSKERIKKYHDDDGEPLKDDEIYEYVEEEIDDPAHDEEQLPPDENREFPDWAYKDGVVRKKRKQRQKIKVRKRVKVKKKKSSRKYKKLAEKIFWTLLLIGFISTLIFLVGELDIFKDKRNVPRGKTMIISPNNSAICDNSHFRIFNNAATLHS